MLYALGALVTMLPAIWGKSIGTMGTVTSQQTIQKLDSGSELVALYTSPSYVDPIYVLSVHGEKSYDQGYDAGVLMGKQINENYNNLFLSLFGDIPIEPTLVALTNWFLDWQWDDYLSKDVPQEYMDELEGLQAGGNSIGVADVGRISSRGITLANLPGEGKDIIFVLIDEFQSQNELTPEQKALLPKVADALSHYGHSCSMFGIWGSRTQNGHLYTARNLDWLTDLGINKYKLITVHHPPNGYSHATIGFAGIWGAMAGMSSQGITVHEANLESKLDTFQGFPWITRLRHVMAYSKTLDEAKQIWDSTNNTVGFNHMIGSANDQRSMVMETMKGYTTYFNPMDAREDGALDPQDPHEQYGFTLTDAIYRTNHGYDNVTTTMYQWYGYHAYEDSKRRYNGIYNSFLSYEQQGVLVGPEQAVYVTSQAAIKGDGTDENNCNESLYLDGENILSVTYDPTARTVYTAFEDGSGDAWIPAGCNGYIQVDLSQWF